MDWSLPGSSGHGILQGRILEWVPISSSRGPSPLRDRTQVSCIVIRPFALWSEAPPSGGNVTSISVMMVAPWDRCPQSQDGETCGHTRNTGQSRRVKFCPSQDRQVGGSVREQPCDLLSLSQTQGSSWPSVLTVQATGTESISDLIRPNNPGFVLEGFVPEFPVGF